MTDAYDELRKDWCDEGDMPRATCHHCGARPGGPSLPPLDRPWSFDGQPMTRRTGRDIFPTRPTPEHEPRPLKFGPRSGDTCACGRPTRNNAFGCDDCADELTRTLTDTPWLAEQLDTTITRQRAMQPGARGADAIVWNDRAAKVQRDLSRHLATTVKLCVDQHVRHSSPYSLDPNTDSAPSMARWLLWRVDGLTLNAEFDAILRQALKIEAQALGVIDAAPDVLYLGLCGARNDDEMCTGAVYAVAGEAVGKCRACRARYASAVRREALQQQLDDRLCTAAEIAHLATYLGIEKPRDQVRKLVNQWHKRGLIAAAPGKGEPRFRYGDVVPRLAAAYSKGA